MENVYNNEMTIKDWVITNVLIMIPLVGQILLFVWAFGNKDKVNPNKANFAKAMLVMMLIAFAVSLLFSAIIGSLFVSLISSFAG